MKRAFSLFFVLLLPAWAEAATWSVVASNGKMRAEMDIASFMRQGNIVTAWDREVYFEPAQAQPGDFYFKSTKSLTRYSCDGRTADLLMRVYYAEDGSEIKTVTASYYGRQNYVIPDTDIEKMFEFACKYKKVPVKKAVATVAEKDKKSKEADKSAEPPARKDASAAKAKPSAEALPKAPTRSLPIHKPSGAPPPKPPTETGKGTAQK